MMTLQEIIDILEARLVCGGKPGEIEIGAAFGSDLMSDVLARSKSHCLLLTGLTNPQTVRAAEMLEMAAICYVQGKIPIVETVALAETKGVVLIGTRFSMYVACGKLYNLGLAGCDDLL